MIPRELSSERTPTELVTGNTPDISHPMNFSFTLGSSIGKLYNLQQKAKSWVNGWERPITLFKRWRIMFQSKMH